ncbi:MAG: hypothetical protein JXO22_01470 [Phycisphaerae bacterium]|nr:hypothetical protein [Phycisphaerae bacterium]
MAVRKDSIMGLIAALVLIAAVVIYFARSGGKIEPPSKTTFNGVCLACKWEGQHDRYAGDMPPYKCHSCGERAMYMWRWCPSCKKRCVPVMEKRESGDWLPPAFPKCPKCGADVAPYDPDALEYMEDIPKPIETLPLPAWPFKE